MSYHHPRREFPAQVKRDAYERSRSICECHLIPWLHRPNGCGVALRPGAIFYEHIVPDHIGGAPTLENCATLCRTCWKEKTSAYDRKIIAKSNHVQDRARGIPRSGKGRPLIGTIASGWKHLMTGKWERR